MDSAGGAEAPKAPPPLNPPLFQKGNSFHLALKIKFFVFYLIYTVF